ncbi:meckelin isoform X1 [Osmia bicornis bicornis]|uniref:meckelin isoform X1 n=1 Tax=Osmia bicornis bicornis TaxID=1437191 RepID=UPI001EAF2DA2|nr:meckelin isoform X1 [Osmia bicornis bicornis]
MKMNHLKEKNIISYFLMCYFNFLQPLAANKEVVEFSQPSKCKNNEYFNTASFSCTQCDINKNLKPSPDRLRCTCDRFNKRTLKNDVFYSLNATITAHESNCTSCNNATYECTTDEIQVDRNLNNTSVDIVCYSTCPDNHYPSADRSKCFPCKNLNYNYYIDYIYSTNYYYTRIQDYCSFKDTSLDKQDSVVVYQVKFETENVDSYYFRNELEIAMYFCKRKNALACEHLSNMCALSLYANNIACILFMQPLKAPVWLFYDKNKTTAVLRSTQITHKYKLRYNNDNILNFTVATFSLHGTLKVIGTPDMPCNLLQNIRFGINLKKKCKLILKNLLTAKVELLTPYLTFVENNKSLMHALPILIKNINKNDNEVSTWQLVRKFFFVDNVSGFKTLSNFSTDEVKRANELSVLRYIRSLNVMINIQISKDRNKIFPPLLIIEYAELTYEQISKTTEVTLDYRIEFILNDSTINRNLQIIIGVFSGLAFIFSGIKTWNYSKRHHISFFNIYILLWAFVYAAGTIGSVIILSLIIFCIYLFTFYKGQTIPYILLPGDINDETIKMCTILAFSFKFIEILGFICQYWNIDIIFLDWEQPKAIDNQFKYDSLDNTVNKLHVNKFSKDKYKVLQTPSEIIAAKRKKIIHQLHKQSNSAYIDKSSIVDKYKTDFSPQYSGSNISVQEKGNFHNLPISIWRTYFIANQWLNLQTQRKISVIIQIVAVLCTFQVIQLYPWILAIPELTSNSSDSNYNFILYYTICILIYISIYCIQWVVSTVTYQLFIPNRMQEFVKLCSVANISVFILPFNYYGFYIHGRSVHGFADIDLPTLMNNLEKEKNNLCAHKGLVPGTTQQTFILSLTPTFKNIFQKTFIATKIKQNNFLEPYSVATINWEQTFNSQFKLKQFLYKFVDHCSKEDYIIKEQHFFEKLLNILLPHTDEKSIFYIDTKNSFDQVLLCGNEWLLATFEISIFTFIIVLCEDCTLAITITILISVLLISLAQHNNKRNLDNNMLLDKAFLM